MPEETTLQSMFTNYALQTLFPDWEAYPEHARRISMAHLGLHLDPAEALSPEDTEVKDVVKVSDEPDAAPLNITDIGIYVSGADDTTAKVTVVVEIPDDTTDPRSVLRGKTVREIGLFVNIGTEAVPDWKMVWLSDMPAMYAPTTEETGIAVSFTITVPIRFDNASQISLITDNDSLATRIGELETEVGELDNRLTDAEGDITDINDSIDDLNTSIGELGNRLTDAEGDITDISDSIDNLNTRIGTPEPGISDDLWTYAQGTAALTPVGVAVIGSDDGSTFGVLASQTRDPAITFSADCFSYPQDMQYLQADFRVRRNGSIDTSRRYIVMATPACRADTISRLFVTIQHTPYFSNSATSNLMFFFPQELSTELAKYAARAILTIYDAGPNS